MKGSMKNSMKYSMNRITKGLGIVLVSALLPTTVMAWPWSTDMMNQPSIKPQEGAMTPFPSRSVPVMGIPTKVANRAEAKDLVNPVPVTAASLTKGRNLFRIYCSACHGLTGKAESPVSSKVDLTYFLYFYDYRCFDIRRPPGAKNALHKWKELESVLAS